jgi:hypothetical protein
VTPYHDILYNHALIISKVRYRIEHTFSSLFLYNLKHILANSFEDDLERKIYRTKLSASERQVICLTLIYYVSFKKKNINLLCEINARRGSQQIDAENNHLSQRYTSRKEKHSLMYLRRSLVC